ncbi:S8 family peptidase [Microbaculum marinisediminis]|uniref:S8 family peptidase n=1 Tax=Microbaculum marinisediminis TaxID=2931392 RepID=A0AAW5QUW5_9HYPH|nr:S8 family peptidase [Microbaculum sp. A6E488]MCT8970694.1 S8 family peptidase [Microbaculum sp. A6E488]
MARYEHLQLLRLPERFQRRKAGGGRPPPPRNPAAHSQRLDAELNLAIETQQRRRRPEFVDPSLILKVQMSGALLEEDWNRVGLTLLSSDDDRTLVLFASTDDMAAFRERLAAYGQGVPLGCVNPAYAAFIGGIEGISAIAPRDRIGIRAREDGFTEVADFQAGTIYTVDAELWDLGRRDLRTRKIEDISAYVQGRNGEELDRYIGPSISLVRIRCDGAIIQTLLGIDEIAEIDFPPEPDVSTGEAVDFEMADLPPLGEVGEDAPLIGVIDSGVNLHPLIEDIIVGAIGVPEALGTADDFGHGTFVSGISTFGDLRAQLDNGTLDRAARLCSAKVLDHTGNFPDRRLTPALMRDAITQLSQEFDCRIFVIALGDRKKVFDGGKVGPWAATLDELARDLDVLIIVAAGNRNPRVGNRIEQAVTEYPGYLLEPTNRLCEPAGAINVITVGSLAQGDGMGPLAAGSVGVRPITNALEPSPFSRAGPGIREGIKPDLVDVGGTLVYDPIVARLRGGEDLPEAGVLSLHNVFVDRLFAGRSGTSYSAPLVAFKASQILARFPNASANLIRALLAGSASIPAEARARLQPLGADAERAICGHGLVDIERAVFSDDARVALYAEDELEVDHFAVYQIPIPEAFQTERGRRTIRVSLAYDPPVRHSRRDYAGNTMGFRLIRGCEPDLIFEHFRRRVAEDGPFPALENRFNCSLEPRPTLREKSSLQTATASFSRDVSHYGDTYHLVVRCAGGWAADVGRQAFAVVVEIAHEAEIQLYEQLRQRVRIQT